jgi:integrase
MTLNAYLKEIEGKRVSKYTLKNYRVVLRTLNEFKPLDELTKGDLIKYFTDHKGKDSSISLHQVIIKKYFRDQGKHELIDWIKIKVPKETLKAEDIPTTEDINKLIDATDSAYWKAFISFFFEAGLRFSEKNTLKYRNFKDTTDGMIVDIPTSKTGAGFRKVILPFSSQYIRNLKAQILNNSPDDIVFHLGQAQTNKILHEIAKRAGINKTISAHKFRHAQATDMVKRNYNEAIIRKKLGWTPTSGMIARYQHLNDEDVINATLEIGGKVINKPATRTEIKEAEKITLVDAAMQFSKLTDENAELKERISQLEKTASVLDEDMIQVMIEKRVSEILSKN